MDDENPMFRTNTQFANFADDDAVKEAQEKWEADQKLTAEEKARMAYEDALADDEDDQKAPSTKESESKPEAATEEVKAEKSAEELLEELMGGDDDEEEIEAEEPTEA